MRVIERSGSDIHGNALWTCKCDCENVVSVRASFLKRGQQFCSKQCPRYHEHHRIDIQGQRFTKLVAMRRLRFTGTSRKAVWEFLCDCGKVVPLTADNVMSGNTTSCGCLGIASRIKHGKSKTIEYHREAHRRWAEANPAKALANVKKRREDFRHRIPKWLSKEHWKQINAFYIEARKLTRQTGIPYCVDHKHPLRAKTLSGLHVPWNLQVMTVSDNAKKSARLIDDVCWTNGNI